MKANPLRHTRWVPGALRPRAAVVFFTQVTRGHKGVSGGKRAEVVVDERRQYAGGGRKAGKPGGCPSVGPFWRFRIVWPVACRGGVQRCAVTMSRIWLVAAVLAGTLAGALAGSPGAAPAVAADAAAPAVMPARDAVPVGEPCPLTSLEHVARLVAPVLPDQGYPEGQGAQGDQGGRNGQSGRNGQGGQSGQRGQGAQGKPGAASATARVGAPLAVVVALDGPPLPSGVFPVVNIDKAAGPEGGRVSSTTGYPESEVRFSAPGRYELDLTVTLVARSSCGGAKARTVMERRVSVEVAP